MIGDPEISARARRLGLLPAHVWKDYVMNHVLAALADMDESLAFRGGTALSRVYWPDYRLSEDLDFVTGGIAGSLEEPLVRAVGSAAKHTGFDLRVEPTWTRSGWSRWAIRWNAEEVVVDANGPERTAFAAESRKLDLPYSDLQDRDRKISVVSLKEILGNKWSMLDERDEPRDLFDVWAALRRYGVPFEDLVEGHRKKYGYPPIRKQLQRARRLSDLWEIRLGHQLAELPAFDEVYEVVRVEFEAWAAETGSNH